MNRLYAYLYDDFLSDRSFEKTLANIETRVSVLGIQGRIARLAIFRSPRELVQGLVREGAETIVVVGNDRTLQKTMWFLPDLPVTVGYIPVSEPCRIADILGIPFGEAACDVLAARRIECLDVGRLNDRYFLTECRIESTRACVDIEGRFRISPQRLGNIIIRNLGTPSSYGTSSANAADGWLEIIIQPLAIEAKKHRFPFFSDPEPPRPETALLLQEGMIFSDDPVDIVIDGQKLNGFSFSFGITPKRLKFITSRNRRLLPRDADLKKTANLGTFTRARGDGGLHIFPGTGGGTGIRASLRC
ncbi:MAG: hypothetical protein AMXMBFR16_01280 [Candidatus Uhrbacteria bacterium]